MAARDDSWALSVPGGGGHDLLTVSPVLEACLAGSQMGVAPIGLINMLNAGGAVLKAQLTGRLTGGVVA